MKVIRCASCGHTVYKEFPRCPACGKKSLVFQHSYESSGAVYQQMMKTQDVSGSNPIVSMAVVTLLISGLSYVLFTWMFPQQSLLPFNNSPKTIASVTK